MSSDENDLYCYKVLTSKVRYIPRYGLHFCKKNLTAQQYAPKSALILNLIHQLQAMIILKSVLWNVRPAALAMVLFLFMSTDDIFSQNIRRPSSKSVKKKEKATELQDRLTGDIKLGNLGFFQDLHLSGKGNVGYKVADYFSAGLGCKVFYSQIFIAAAPDQMYTDLGGFVYARGKIFENFFLQAEYNYTSFDYLNGALPGEALTYPSVGGGYASGVSNWRFGVEINLLLNERARDYQGSVLEYWVGAFYNF